MRDGQFISLASRFLQAANVVSMPLAANSLLEEAGTRTKSFVGRLTDEHGEFELWGNTWMGWKVYGQMRHDIKTEAGHMYGWEYSGEISSPIVGEEYKALRTDAQQNAASQAYTYEAQFRDGI
jgi:hypothetical protein